MPIVVQRLPTQCPGCMRKFLTMHFTFFLFFDLPIVKLAYSRQRAGPGCSHSQPIVAVGYDDEVFDSFRRS